MQKILIVDNVRSAYNVGSLFRTSDGAGVSRIILVGYTPTPLDRFGRVQLEIAKTSLGASTMITWEKRESGIDIETCITTLKNEGFSIVAVEQTKEAVSLYDFKVPEKVAYILGNEIDGVSKDLLKVADVVVHIPMQGQKESLNVGVATGIILFHK
jgi:23S rRNA (guanosine2251-2'-O)-methyltransferase